MALWDLRNLGSKVHEMLGHDEEIYQLAWSPHHDAILATGSNDKTIRVWDVARIGDLQSPEDAQDGPPELLVSTTTTSFIFSNRVGMINLILTFE